MENKMERRRFVSLLATGLAGAGLYNFGTYKKSVKPPNLIFILADDLGFGDVECFGGRRINTPNLNKMADEGMRFTQFHSAAAVCSPTRASCLTGRYPLRFDITCHFNDREMHLPASVPTLPKLLGKAGYVSMHIGKWHLGGLNIKYCENREASIPGPQQHGFDHYLCMYEDPQIRAELIKNRRLYREGANYLVRDDISVGDVDKHWTDYKIEEALAFIEQSHQNDKPFFLNLWFDVPHTPYEPAPEPNISPYQNKAHGDDLLYRSMVNHLDFGVGQVLKKLKDLNIENDTFVIFTSDNGPSLQGSPGAFKGRKGDLIMPDPLAPGNAYSIIVDPDGKPGLFRIEVGISVGTGKIHQSGGMQKLMKESLQRAFVYLKSRKVEYGIGKEVDNTDFHVECVNLLGTDMDSAIGVAFFVAMYSALKKKSVKAATIVLGDMTIQGNIKPLTSVQEPLQIGMDNGARKACIPIENKRHFLEVPADIVEQVDPIFFSEPMVAAQKCLE